MNDIVEYDSVVNQFFLPMIKQKLENPKDEIQKEIKKQNDKLKRIKDAYINEVFTLEEYDTERKNVEKTIEDLEFKLNETDICDILKFTPEDILIKRDIDFINSIKYPEKYKEYNKSWKDFKRDEKAELIMNYIEDIKLIENNNNIEVDFVKFRESIANPCNELYFNGYIDRSEYALFGNVIGTLRYSEYRPLEEVWQHLLRLREFYDVKFYEATYNLKQQVFRFRTDFNKTIVRVFPMEDYKNIDPNQKLEDYNLGIIYIENNDETLMENKEDVFNYIPEKIELEDGGYVIIKDGEYVDRTRTKVKPVTLKGFEETFIDDEEE